MYVYVYKFRHIYICIWLQTYYIYTNLLYACTVGQKKNNNKIKHPCFFQYKLSNRNKTAINHHGLLSTSVWCFKIFLSGASTWGSQPNFNFFNVKPQNFQRNRKVHLTNCLETYFHNISNISLRVIRRKNYN